MQCSKCQAAIATGAKFCPKCGAPVAPPDEATGKRCPQCGTENPANAKFCKKDGYRFDAVTDKPDTLDTPASRAPVVMPVAESKMQEGSSKPPSYAGGTVTCPKCGTVNSSAAKFCKKDGYPLQAPGAVTPPETAPILPQAPSAIPFSKQTGVDTGLSPPVPPVVPQTNPVKQPVPIAPRPVASTAPSSKAPVKAAAAKSSRRLAIGMAAGLAILASAAGGYYFYSQSSASPETDSFQTARNAEPPTPGSSAVPESGTPALSEETAIDGFPPGNNIGPAVDKAKQIMARGESVYLKYCSACHQVNGRGLPGAFPAIDGSKIATGDIDKHILVVIHGRPGTAMVSFSNQLTDAEIAAVVTYQRNAWSNRDSGAILDADYIKQFRHPINKPQVSLIPPATATRAPEKPKQVRELLIGRWQMAGGITEFRPDGSSQGYRGDGSPLNSGWWRLEGDRLTIGWMRNGRRQEVGCTVLSVNEKELQCKNGREVQRATRLTSENLPQRQVDHISKPVEQDRGAGVTNTIRQFLNRELEKSKQCEGKWGKTPECPASSWDE